MIVGTLGVPLAVGQIDVNPQNYTYTKSGWFYVTMVTVSLLVVLGIVATLLGRRKRG